MDILWHTPREADGVIQVDCARCGTTVAAPTARELARGLFDHDLEHGFVWPKMPDETVVAVIEELGG